jgi:hypothetical protein
MLLATSYADIQSTANEQCLFGEYDPTTALWFRSASSTRESPATTANPSISLP